ncbi:MAG: hypothetical protein ABW321_13130 [Polyangiales bacterium]
MKRACLTLLATCITSAIGCDAISEGADQFTTVSIGTGALSEVSIDRTMTLGPAEYIPACLDIAIVLPTDNTQVAMKPTDGGCTLSIFQPDIVILNQTEIENARSAAGRLDVDGVRRAKVELLELQLSTADGTPLALTDFIETLTVQIDGQTLLDRTSAADIEGGTDLERELPESLVDKLKSSVKDNQVATADVSLTMWLQAQAITNLPGTLKLVAVLQPKLDINAIDAL